jgi:diguanylate cyclase (GGDEF)-like protein/putative nucleotidyltransferase with HDIG domain
MLEKVPFLFGENDFIDRIQRGSYEARLLCDAGHIDVIKQFIPEKTAFYLESPGEWSRFEFLYLLEGELNHVDGNVTRRLGASDYIVCNMLEEKTWFESVTDVTILSMASPSAFKEMNDATTEFHQISSKIESDEYVGGHCKRIENMAIWLASELNLQGEQLGNLCYAAFFHDIGKAKVPEHILQKPTSLNDEEWKVIHQHSRWGKEMLEKDKDLVDVANIVEQIHERVDGMGYPNNLSGDEIRIEAKIIAVVDAFDAMTTDRIYRRAMDQESAIEELQKHAGSQFDANVVYAFVRLLETKGLTYKKHQNSWFDQEFTRLKQREAFLKVAEGILAGEKLSSIIRQVVSAVSDYTQFSECALVLFNDSFVACSESVNSIAEIASEGYTSEMEELLSQTLQFTRDRQNIFDNDSKIGRSHYVPRDHQYWDILCEFTMPIEDHPVFDKEKEGIEGVLFVPLRGSEGQIHGVITLVHRKSQKRITASRIEPLEMFSNLVSIAIREMQYKVELRTLATHDMLTDAFNRNYMAELVIQEQDKENANNKPISILMLDFVEFHKINDMFGHLTGDRVLKEAAQVMKDTIRAEDSLIRYGGDEFLVFLPNVEQEAAKEMAVRLQDSIHRHDFDVPFGVAIRTGFAYWAPERDVNFDQILEEADTWIYRKKRPNKRAKGIIDSLRSFFMVS